jgi:regulator of replication initiation timing
MINNTCKTENQQLTIMDMMAKISSLEQENLQLKAENIELKNDNDFLHNRLDRKYEENEKVNNNGQGGWTEEEFDIASEGWYKEYDNYSIKQYK